MTGAETDECVCEREREAKIKKEKKKDGQIERKNKSK